MADPKTRPTDASVEDFLAAVEPAGRRMDAQAACAVMGEVSGLKPVMWGPSIVGFGATMMSGNDWPEIAFSPRKANLVLYLGDFEGREAVVAKFSKAKASVGCVYLTRLSPDDGPVLREACEKALAATRAGKLDG
ncbi:MAG: DUF1801 domain-containing protein [Brevundimonas sp.]|nr:MAG: DUF1801 domain-containing protein [Brevundimonas sp.]